MTAPGQTDEALAKSRYMMMHGVRIGSLCALMIGLMIARSIIDAPYALGVVLAVGGLLAFYFGPRALAKKWKSRTDNTPGDETK